MSWQCTMGPYGRYPGEDGYEDDLERYEIDTIETELTCKLYGDDDGPWYRNIYYEILDGLKTLSEIQFTIPKDDYMREEFINYLHHKHNFFHFRIKKDTEIYLFCDDISKGVNIKDIDDIKKPFKRIEIWSSNQFDSKSCASYDLQYINISIIDIYNDAPEKHEKCFTNFIKNHSKKVVIFRNK